eukprot:NODE_20_length_39102_cov_0.325513.p1 type:complete len:1232 gc:universal NODE_20_length_39102_cov_0.325513:12470-16165(+)
MLLSNSNSKFYKMRMDNVQLTFRYKDEVSKYLVDNINHLNGLAFAFNHSPYSFIRSISGRLCWSYLQRNKNIPTILSMSKNDLLSIDLPYVIYQALLTNNSNVLSFIQSTFDGDTFSLGGPKLCRWLLSNISTSPSLLYNCLTELNTSVDNEFIGLVVFIKVEYDPFDVVVILCHVIPQLSLIKELHLFIFNTILQLIPLRPSNIGNLIELYLRQNLINDASLFKLSAYCHHFKLSVTLPASSANPFERFSDKIVNLYILHLVYVDEIPIPNDKIPVIITFIMSLDAWPSFYKYILCKMQYNNDILTDIPTSVPTLSNYHSTILNNCINWLVNNDDPLRHGYLIQETVIIMSQYHPINDDLLRPYLNTNYISHKPQLSNNNESLINRVTGDLDFYYKKLLLLYAQWIDVLPSPFYDLLQDCLVFYYCSTPLGDISPSIASLLGKIPRKVLESSYFRCKYTLSKLFMDNIKYGIHSANCSFYSYFSDLLFYLDIFKESNIYEAIMIHEQLYYNSALRCNMPWLMNTVNIDLIDFKSGLLNNSNILSNWETIHDSQNGYNHCIDDLMLITSGINYPLQVDVLKQLQVPTDIIQYDKYASSCIKACRLQNVPLFIHNIPNSFNSQLEYAKYNRANNNIVAAFHALNSIKSDNHAPSTESLSLQLEELKIKIKFKLDSSTNILAQYQNLATCYSNAKIYKKLGDYCNELYSQKPQNSLGLNIVSHYSNYLKSQHDVELTMIPRIITLFQRIDVSTLVIHEFLSICESNKYSNCIPHVSLITSFLATSDHTFMILITGLINGLLKHYHKRVGWHMISSLNSKNPEKKQKMHRILNIYCKQYKVGDWMNTLIKTSQYLIRLSEMQFEKHVTEVLLSKEYKKLQRLIDIDVYVPFANVLNLDKENATINKFGDHVTLLNSLVRPKKMKIHASDGIVYDFLLKKDEDLRKDERYLEVAAFVNRRFNKNKQTKQRRLHLRTYNVTVLNELNGLIEWMNNTETLRKIITSILKIMSIKVSMNKIRLRLESQDREAEFNKILKEIPPVLHLYFCNLYPNPSLYFENRMGFIRTTAAMSMVGYALGLGDRHCENILIDVVNGDLVHVDFNCLFEKGKRLSIPEVVPFRLTQNIIRVFGATGYEGPYRKACELTLELLRKQYYYLDNILDSFLNDPLLEWQNRRENESPTELAQKKLDLCKNRVFGQGQHGIPLSVEGTVHCAIMEATSSKNLSQMYLGWMPYL